MWSSGIEEDGIGAGSNKQNSSDGTRVITLWLARKGNASLHLHGNPAMRRGVSIATQHAKARQIFWRE